MSANAASLLGLRAHSNGRTKDIAGDEYSPHDVMAITAPSSRYALAVNTLSRFNIQVIRVVIETMSA